MTAKKQKSTKKVDLKRSRETPEKWTYTFPFKQSEEQGLHQPSQLVAHQEDGSASEGRQTLGLSLLWN